MDDRDHFAAAALTGFASQLRYGSVFDLTLTAKQCYELADAMLRERDQATPKPQPRTAVLSTGDVVVYPSTNHDAAPAARASVGRPRTDRADLPTRCGTGNTQEPAAWGILRVGGSWVSIVNNAAQADTSRKSWDKQENWVHEVVPLYRHPQPTLTDEEREALLWFAHYGLPEHRAAAILRRLLERLHT